MRAQEQESVYHMYQDGDIERESPQSLYGNTPDPSALAGPSSSHAKCATSSLLSIAHVRKLKLDLGLKLNDTDDKE